MGSRLLFLGIVSDVIEREIAGKMEYHTENIKYQSKPKERIVPIPYTDRLLNIGIVFKPSIIIRTIEEFFPELHNWENMFLVHGEGSMR